MERMVICAGRELHYCYFIKKVKNINLRVGMDGVVHVSANRRTPLSFVDDVVRKRAEWIFSAQEKAAKRQAEACCQPPFHWKDGDKIHLLGKEYPLRVAAGARKGFIVGENEIFLTVKNPDSLEARKKAFIDGYREYADGILRNSVTRMLALYISYPTVPMPEVRIRRMKTRWGSCAPQKKLVTINLYLVQAPLACIDSVTAHELAHFVAANHSKDFYRVLETVMPDYRARFKLLTAQHLVCSESSGI